MHREAPGSCGADSKWCGPFSCNVMGMREKPAVHPSSRAQGWQQHPSTNFDVSSELKLLLVTECCCFGIFGTSEMFSGICLELLLPYLNDASNCHTQA